MKVTNVLLVVLVCVQALALISSYMNGAMLTAVYNKLIQIKWVLEDGKSGCGENTAAAHGVNRADALATPSDELEGAHQPTRRSDERQD